MNHGDKYLAVCCQEIRQILEYELTHGNSIVGCVTDEAFDVRVHVAVELNFKQIHAALGPLPGLYFNDESASPHPFIGKSITCTQHRVCLSCNYTDRIGTFRDIYPSETRTH